MSVTTHRALAQLSLEGSTEALNFAWLLLSSALYDGQGGGTGVNGQVCAKVDKQPI